MPSQRQTTTRLFNAIRRLWELIWPSDPQPAPAYAKAPARAPREPIPIQRTGEAQPGEWRPLWRGPQSRRRTTGPLDASDE